MNSKRFTQEDLDKMINKNISKSTMQIFSRNQDLGKKEMAKVKLLMQTYKCSQQAAVDVVNSEKLHRKIEIEDSMNIHPLQKTQTYQSLISIMNKKDIDQINVLVFMSDVLKKSKLQNNLTNLLGESNLQFMKTNSKLTNTYREFERKHSNAIVLIFGRPEKQLDDDNIFLWDAVIHNLKLSVWQITDQTKYQEKIIELEENEDELKTKEQCMLEKVQDRSRNILNLFDNCGKEQDDIKNQFNKE